MPTYYDYGLGLDDPTQITETGDELASAANYIEPENVDFAHYTWENQPVSEYVTRLIRDSDHPQLSSPLIYITIPSGSPYNIYDSTNTVLVSGIADENNDREYTLDYQLTGASADTGDITPTTAWSFTTSALEFGNTTVRTNIVSDMGPRAYDSVVITRTPTLSPTVTITTETSATTASDITIEGTASDPNSLPFTVTYELSGARTDSGIATGTTAWTFTEGLSAGDNRFDVTATNTYDLSGSDYLIVNKYTPSPPSEEEWNDRTSDTWWSPVGGAVWVTDHWECNGAADVLLDTASFAHRSQYRPTKIRMTHTSGLAKFRVLDGNYITIATIENYASETEVDITYNGTTDKDVVQRIFWEINTDGAGAGNITAIELFDPVLDYWYDPFTSDQDRWYFRRVPTGGNWDLDLTGGMDATMDDEDQILVRQIWNQGEIDVWGNIDIWDQPSGDMSIYLVFRGDGGANASEFTLQWDGSQHNLNIQASDGGGSDELDLQDIGQDNVWIRLKYKPITDSDTKMHLYYAFSDPTVGGWTEATLSVSPIFDPAWITAGNNWALEIEFTNDSVEDDLGLEVESLTEWTL